MFNDTSSLAAYLASRRSGKPRDLVAPGPSDAQIREMVAIAARTPDHGKLFPWRFVVVPEGKRDAFAALLTRALRASRPDATRLDLDAAEQFAHQSPTLIVVLSAPHSTQRIPLWEQELSAGAATMNLIHAAHAAGFAAGWLTGWATYDETVRRAFAGPESDARIAGFVFIGTPARPLEERPRPALEAVLSVWEG